MIRLLIVDDDDLQRKALRHILEKTQPPIIEVIGEAEDGQSAINLSVELNPDIVLMDIEMPEMNGLLAIKEIRENNPNTYIIVITAYDYFEYAQQTLKLGAVDYLLKPVRPEKLLAAIKKASIFMKRESSKIEEEKKLREQVAHAMPYITMAFVQDLILGDLINLDEIQDRANFLGLENLPAMVMIFDIDNFSFITNQTSETEKQILKTQVSNVITSTIKHLPSALLVPWSGDELLVLLPQGDLQKKEPAQQQVMSIADEIRTAVAQHTSVTVSVGVGRSYLDVREIRKSYQEALIALQDTVFAGQNISIHIDDFQEYNSSMYLYPLEKEQHLVSFVRMGNQDKALNTLDDIINSFHNVSVEIAKVRLLELLIVTSRGAAEGGVDSAQLFVINQHYLEQLSASMNFLELKEIASWAISQFTNHVATRRKDRNWRLLKDSQVYIEANYQQNLTLVQVAAAVHLSPEYFSRLFRQEQGETFTEYLSSLRLEKAKQFLTTSNRSVGEISMTVGYSDQNYFSRVFRKATGMSPTEFRNR
ncbi:MAG: hypothetical protein A2X25_06320 [Chloroflexi bacterium GWB2_49_20]|nr:MAG: hypothetical protein A2X25_06320 [Chloroflexi bacterium GWB2_49_20]OGN80343.1 MAG: hypothetical protein A2X26_08460 [Chloroflexi bacterium GWC2_49_37]OGN85667.1 MAG: hypothetical protein A2X27_13585 [Chloroflexi bacterium GWD2_49_16]HCC79315.1 hypothetical protein [Anaerolineae bacterium]HCM96464.1 hypothetical protein [Anaerolineae bacterium]